MPTKKLCNYIPDPDERKNAITSLIDGSLYSVMAGLTTPFWGAFAVKLGASDYLLGLLTSLPALAGLLAQIPSALLIDRFENRLKPTLAASIIHRTFFVVFALLALMPAPADIKSWVFVLAFAIMNVPGTMAGIAWTAMMGEMFTPELRGRIFGERNRPAGGGEQAGRTGRLASTQTGPSLPCRLWSLTIAKRANLTY